MTGTPSTPSKPTRQRKSHQQRAQEALVSTRRVQTLKKREVQQKADLAQTQKDLAAEQVRHEYLAKSPDLQGAKGETDG